tara:strand:- start:20038 stop:20304 length:267 start_codon:yes stop_codon:yes gene_type:complete
MTLGALDMCGDAPEFRSEVVGPTRQLLEIRFRIDVPFPGRALQVARGSDGRVELDDMCRQDYLFARTLERLGRAHSRIVGDTSMPSLS